MMTPKKANAKIYGQRNYILLATGIFVICLGYIALGIKPEDGFMTMTLAPFLLVGGYCIILPIALFLKPSENKSPQKIKSIKGD